jgi:DNA-binding protein YbaB
MRKVCAQMVFDMSEKTSKIPAAEQSSKAAPLYRVLTATEEFQVNGCWAAVIGEIAPKLVDLVAKDEKVNIVELVETAFKVAADSFPEKLTISVSEMTSKGAPGLGRFNSWAGVCDYESFFKKVEKVRINKLTRSVFVSRIKAQIQELKPASKVVLKCDKELSVLNKSVRVVSMDGLLEKLTPTFSNLSTRILKICISNLSGVYTEDEVTAAFESCSEALDKEMNETLKSFAKNFFDSLDSE